MTGPMPAPARLLVALAPYAAVSLVHVIALGIGADALAVPTKLLLMPALALGVLWAGGAGAFSRAGVLLLTAIALSWLGDGAGSFFPFLPDLPVMLAFFGLAHLCYIWLFTRIVAVRRQPAWTIVYAAWWVVLLLMLWPRLGPLTVAVAAYGIVLGATAATAARGRLPVLVGGAFFLASDTVLAFRLFTPEAMPHWTSPLVMLTYTLGQGLIAAGVVAGFGRGGPGKDQGDGGEPRPATREVRA